MTVGITRQEQRTGTWTGTGPGTWLWPLLGLGGGLLWGAVARAWMRFVSSTPEFSWSGTLGILAMTGIAGLCLGTVEALRRNGSGWWRRFMALPALLMFASPGMLMLPSALFGAVALSGRGGLRVRLPATALAFAPLTAFGFEDGSFPRSATVSVSWYVLLCLALAAGWLPLVLLAGCSPVDPAAPLPSPSPAVAPALVPDTAQPRPTPPS